MSGSFNLEFLCQIDEEKKGLQEFDVDAQVQAEEKIFHFTSYLRTGFICQYSLLVLLQEEPFLQG